MKGEYIVDLLESMSYKDEITTAYPSSSSISWKAYREAEQLQCHEYIPILVNFIQKSIKKREVMLISYLRNSRQNMRPISP